MCITLEAGMLIGDEAFPVMMPLAPNATAWTARNSLACLVLLSAIALPACQTQTQESMRQAPKPIERGMATEDTSRMRIALSMSFVDGSSYRQTMVESFERAAQTAQRQGLLADFIVLDANGSTDQQAEQLQQLIDAKYDAILLNPNSVSKLNARVKAVCEAGILAIAFDNTVTEPCAYTINTIWNHYGALQGNYLRTRLEQGNVLEVRGAKGTTGDTDISAAIRSALAQFPTLKIVASVHGNWTQHIAQQEVAAILPSLPPIDAVVTQGGDGYGTALAFSATQRPMPIVIMGNRYDELKWWQDQRDANGYQTISASATPGASAVAFWTAQQILAGKDVPKFLELPLLVIEAETLDTWLAITPPNGTANADYTLEWTVELIDAHLDKTPLPAPPIPSPP